MIVIVMSPHVSGQQPVHPLSQIRAMAGTHKEMEVIGHQAGGEQFKLDASLSFTDQRHEASIVPGLVEDLCSAIAAIDHVVALTTNHCTRRPWHMRTLGHGRADVSCRIS